MEAFVIRYSRLSAVEKRKDTNLSESYTTGNCCGMALVSPTLQEFCPRYDCRNVITMLTFTDHA
jgi:hypothetical protein